MSEREQLEKAIAALESQRETLGDAVLAASLTALREKLAALIAADTPREQRKLVTVLFADVSGFTAMSEVMDAEDVNDLMNALWERLDVAIESYDGYVDKHIGDAVMALWGAKTAQEVDAEQAIRAALAMQAALAAFRQEQNLDLAMRIGINTGLVLLGEVGTTAEFTAMGDTVNTASRLEHAAPVDGVLISHDTYRHVRGVFDMQPLDPLSVKGKAEPLKVYRVIKARPRSFRTRRRGVEGIETHMVGRDDEMKLLQDAYTTLIEDGRRQVVTIVGEAGLGKSRLLYEFQEWIDLQPRQPLLYRGRARSETRRLAYGLLRDLFAFRFAIQDGEPPEIVRQKVLAGLGEASTVDESQLEMRAHFVGHLLGFGFRASPHLKDVKDDPQQIRDRSLLYLTDYFRAAAAQNPVLMLLEDLQWADDSSLDLITRLALALDGQPLLAVGASRPDFYERRPRWFDGQPFHRRLELHPLSRQDSRHLLGEILQKVDRVPGPLPELLVSNAEGNPFYIEELVKMLIESGVILTGEERWKVQLDRLRELQVPPTLTGVLQARMDRLPEKERVVLQQASVVGRVFWDAVVIHLNRAAAGEIGVDAHPDGASVRDNLKSLQGREMVYRHDPSAFAGVTEYVFKHAMLREVAYESVLKKARRSYHALVAEWLQQNGSRRGGELAAIIAGHLEQAGKKEEAFDHFRQAGQEAAATFANEEAVDYFSRALALAPADDLQSRYELFLAREKVYDSLGLRPNQRQDLQELEALAQALDDASPSTTTGPAIQPASRRAEVALRWAGFARQTGDYRAMVEAAQRSVTLAGEVGDLGRAARGHLAWGRALWFRGEVERSRARLMQALAMSREGRDRWAQGRTLLLLANIANRLGEQTTAKSHQEQALAIFREIGDRPGETATLRMLGNDDSVRGQHASAAHHFNQALDIAREIANSYEEAALLNNLGFLAHRQGDFSAAQSFFEQTLAIGRQIDYPALNGLALSNLGLVAEALEEYAAARDHQRSALALAREIGHRQREATALNGLGDALAGLEQWAEAKTSYRAAATLWDELGQTPLAHESRAGLARVALAQRDVVAAMVQAEEILAFLQSGGSLQGTENAMRIYLTCVQALQAVGDPRARPFLDATHRLLEERADKITNPAARRLYLENVPWHREIIALWDTATQKG